MPLGWCAFFLEIAYRCISFILLAVLEMLQLKHTSFVNVIFFYDSTFLDQNICDI